jgi:two-component system sensor histidine kinase TctE
VALKHARVNLEALAVLQTGAEKSTAESSRRSLLGEILDWMLAPLFLLWPMSIAITYVVAQNLANTPYDLNLANALQVLGQQVEMTDDVVALRMSPSARLALRIRENDGVFWKAIGPNGDLLGGDGNSYRIYLEGSQHERHRSCALGRSGVRGSSHTAGQ